MSIGILGGGQLGYMLALAGYPLGLRFRFLDPSPEAPVGRIAPRVTGDFSDRAALEKFAHGLEVVTYEFENVPVDAVHFLAKKVAVYPPPGALEAAQDRLREKQLFEKLGIATTEFASVPAASDLDLALKKVGLPAVLKTRRMGYDGKGPVESADAGRCQGGQGRIAQAAVHCGALCTVHERAIRDRRPRQVRRDRVLSAG